MPSNILGVDIFHEYVNHNREKSSKSAYFHDYIRIVSRPRNGQIVAKFLITASSHSLPVMAFRYGTGNPCLPLLTPAWTTNKFRDAKFVSTMKGNPDED